MQNNTVETVFAFRLSALDWEPDAVPHKTRWTPLAGIRVLEPALTHVCCGRLRAEYGRTSPQGRRSGAQPLPPPRPGFGTRPHRDLSIRNRRSRLFARHEIWGRGGRTRPLE